MEKDYFVWVAERIRVHGESSSASPLYVTFPIFPFNLHRMFKYSFNYDIHKVTHFKSKKQCERLIKRFRINETFCVKAIEYKIE